MTQQGSDGAGARRDLLLSVVVPCCNEAECLRALYARVTAACAQSAIAFELVLVDDGSRDRTGEVIRELAAEDTRVRGLLFSRNFGHQAAISAGYDHALGDVVLVMDADLQHPPELIPEFLVKWREGFDVVYAYRRNARPRVGYRLYNWLCNIRIPGEAADFRLMDRRVVHALRRMPERGRFVRGLVAWLGFRQTGIPYDQPHRYAGRPAYSLHKRLRLQIDSVFGFSTMPLRLAMYCGFATLGLGLVYAAYIVGTLLIEGREGIPSGWPALIGTVLVLGGVQLICLGMVAEYVGRIYDEVKRRPLYVVRERIGNAPAESMRHAVDTPAHACGPDDSELREHVPTSGLTS